MKAFGISGRNPVEAEIAYMDKWMKEWGFSEELIGEACGRTMGAIHQPSFEYADRILERWKEKGITRFSELRLHRIASGDTKGLQYKKICLIEKICLLLGLADGGIAAASPKAGIQRVQGAYRYPPDE